MGKDYYKTLGVDKGASQDEIKKAFRKQAHQYHPDKSTGDEAKFKEVNEAYQVLGNEQKRKQYDQFGSSFENMGQGGFGGFGNSQGFGGFQGNINVEDLGDMFGGIGDMFGFGGSSRRRGPRRGSDIEMVMNISFNEAVFGTEKEISFKKKMTCDRCHGEGAEPGAEVNTCSECKGAGKIRKMQRTILGTIQTEAPCPHCGGEGKTFSKSCTKCGGSGVAMDTTSLKVKVPAGIDDGEAIRLSGQGESGDKGASAGDLYIRFRVAPSREFVRNEYDVRNEEEISFTQAVLGDKIDIKTIHGEVALKIPEGTQSGTIFKLKGKGVQILNGRGHGDHLVEVIIKTPKNLNKKQKETLKELGI